MSNYKCDKSHTFRIEVVDTEISVSRLPSPVYEGESIAFTVTVTDVPSLGSYDLEVTAYGAADTTSSSTNSDIGFNSSCSDVEESDDVISGAATQSESHTLHVCDSEYNGGIVTITLVDANDNIVAGDWLYLEARPITVRIEADNPFPITAGTVAERTVTLSANVDGPSSTTFNYYHWQTPAPDDELCTNVQNATSATHDLNSTTATTKSIRVIVKENATDTDCYISEPVYITWDLGQTLREITDALAANFARPPAPTPTPTGGGKSDSSARVPVLPAHRTALLDAESSLLTCAGITDGSFATLMTQYTGETKTLLDSGNCRTQADTMWTALETSFSTTLTNIRTTGTNATAINAFLASEPGQSFVTYMTDSGQLKGSIESFIVPAAGILANEPEPPVSEPDDQGNPDGDSGQDRTTRQGEDIEGQYSGLGCIPFRGTPDATDRASISTKLNVLNCLLFATPWQFWLDLADESDTAAAEEYKERVNEVAWLTYGDFQCSLDLGLIPGGLRPGVDFADTVGERAACLKHDVTYDNLQRIAGDQELSEANPDDDSFEIDEVWNPRNRYLTDIMHFADLECSELTGRQRGGCLSTPDHLVNALGFISWITNPDTRRFYGIAESNDKNFPTTQEDVDHVNGNPIFVQCRQTPIPTVSNIHITISRSFLGSIFMATWAVSGGCGDDDIAVDRVRLCSAELLGSINSCFRSSDTTSSTSRLFGRLPSSFQVDVKIWPENVLYGARNYPKTLYDIVNGESR